MTSPAIALIDAALASNLTQNELKAFLALVRQTLCFGKVSDPLTLKRLSQLSHVRKDRLEPAIESLLDKGLFERTDHLIFDHEYRIPASFLQGANPSFFAPPLPKIGDNFQKSEAFSENRIHTIQTNTILTITDKQADVPVCAVVPTASEEEKAILIRPAEISEEDFKALKPALLTLPSKIAQQVLDLTQLKIQQQQIATTIQSFAGGLIKKARVGGLSITPLQAKAEAVKESTKENHKSDLAPRLNDLRSKIHGLESLRKLAGELDPRSMTLLQAYQAELKQLKDKGFGYDSIR